MLRHLPQAKFSVRKKGTVRVLCYVTFLKPSPHSGKRVEYVSCATSPSSSQVLRQEKRYSTCLVLHHLPNAKSQSGKQVQYVSCATSPSSSNVPSQEKGYSTCLVLRHLPQAKSPVRKRVQYMSCATSPSSSKVPGQEKG